MQIFTCLSHALRGNKPLFSQISIAKKENLKGTLKKTIMRLQLIAIIITFACIQVAAKSYGQITIKLKDAPLEKVFNAVQKQSGYYFMYDKDLVKHYPNVSLDLKSATLDETLKEISKNRALNFQFFDKTIVVNPTKSDSSNLLEIPQAKIIVKGKVTNIEGDPMSDVSVYIKNVGNGTRTDINGKYSIAVNEGDIIIYNYVGYMPEEVKVVNNSTIDIILRESISKLNEMVVKGYYNTTKALNTGTVSHIESAVLKRQPVNDVLMALEGRVPGMYISQTSGIPGAGISVKLRGQNSLANGNDPFYIIDGVPYTSKSLTQTFSANNGINPLSSIRPDDIESIDVLKDADATAIYGSRGANGVILITTKRGKAGQTKIDGDFSVGYGKVARRLDLLNTQQYIDMRNEAFANDNMQPGTTDYDINGTWDKNRYTNWQNEMIGGTASLMNNTLTVSGGNEFTQFLIGGGLRRETTVFPGDNADQKGSVNFNLNHATTDKRFKINFSGNYTIDNNKLPQTDFTQYIFIAPNAPSLYKNGGEINWENSTFNNPIALLKRRTNSSSTNLISNVTASYNITKELQFKTSAGYNSYIVNDEAIQPYTSFNPAVYSGVANLTRSYRFGNNALKSWIIEPQINYSVTKGLHHFDALVGTTIQRSIQESIMNMAQGFTSDALIENPIAAATKTITGSGYTDYKYNAVMARLGYNYQEKYIVNLTGRRDGSSRFGPGRQFGNFGALGLGWIFSKESFFTNISKIISYGKIRGSIGRTGNDQLQDYQFMDTYSPSGVSYNNVGSINPTALTNPNFGWETINKLEAALELGFLDDRIHLNASWYKNRTGNQLVGLPLPSVAGFTTVQANLPAKIDNKGLEFDLSTVNISSKNFTWTSAFNISFPRNKLVDFPNLKGSGLASKYVVGEPLSIYMLYHYTGIDQQTGVYTFEDHDHSGGLTTSGDRLPVFVGQKFFGGLDNSINIKDFQINLFFQFVKQTGFNFKFLANPGQFNYNQPTTVLDRWENPESNSDLQKYSANFSSSANSAINNYYNTSDARISDASFIRLKNLMVSWNLPKAFLDRIKFQRIRLYVQGQNLITLTRFKGLEPETNNSGSLVTLPPLRVINGGIQITL